MVITPDQQPKLQSKKYPKKKTIFLTSSSKNSQNDRNLMMGSALIATTTLHKNRKTRTSGPKGSEKINCKKNESWPSIQIKYSPKPKEWKLLMGSSQQLRNKTSSCISSLSPHFLSLTHKQTHTLSLSLSDLLSPSNVFLCAIYPLSHCSLTCKIKICTDWKEYTNRVKY